MTESVDQTSQTYLFGPHLAHWQMSGHGRFIALDDVTVESRGGPGLFWYTAETFADFVLTVDWRIQSEQDNSGVFLRFPALNAGDPDHDWRIAIDHGYEVQIDDRGYDPQNKREGSPLHRSGAVYRLAPATKLASRSLGGWNRFRIEARGFHIRVMLNGIDVSHLDHDVGRPLRGHVGLQNHHEGSHVQFRNLRIKTLG
jgi:hypothetical protein